eukprot:TRINITY_DN4216_c0_g1_i2.p1 TRINITY_DN4216_c0_g1~~TRINITY_DN4216_c0_g1_i2.p1  ORF type:complete len:137 (-),score=12.74 TRINITY_DN4216_c0_g1_i2:280-690(-)
MRTRFTVWVLLVSLSVIGLILLGRYQYPADFSFPSLLPLLALVMAVSNLVLLPLPLLFHSEAVAAITLPLHFFIFIAVYTVTNMYWSDIVPANSFLWSIFLLWAVVGFSVQTGVLLYTNFLSDVLKLSIWSKEKES